VCIEKTRNLLIFVNGNRRDTQMARSVLLLDGLELIRKDFIRNFYTEIKLGMCAP